MEYKNFKSFLGEDIRVALTSGHVFSIGREEWYPIPQFAWQEAFSLGATSEDTITVDTVTKEVMDIVKIKSSVTDRKAQAKGIILGWLKDNDLSKFSKIDGKPKSSEISKILKCQFQNGMRDEIWFKIQEEVD